jgi:protein involved in polysaccharide export with SLBB domain
MRSKPAVLFIMIFISSLMSAQEDADQQGSLQREVINANPQLALSSPDYQVTAGDIYTLAYTIGSAPVTYRIAVDSGYMVRISNLGIINAEGKTYRQLKAEAEAIVTRNYPLSGAQLVLSQPGIFRVFVNGEVTAAVEVSVWALTRLSSLAGYVTSYASLRNVLVKSGNGQVKNYDLFKAEREGDLSQNPYLRPDDAITFNRLDRQVTISGEVERPGDYQLLDGENLKDLLETYACGFTPLADKTRIELTRFVDSGSVSGDIMLLKETDVN